MITTKQDGRPGDSEEWLVLHQLRHLLWSHL